ncbi:PBP1A family penicillin-binding protein [bacterium]|nr:PBP1A family penicillin-binding protein [bacterium]
MKNLLNTTLPKYTGRISVLLVTGLILFLAGAGVWQLQELSKDLPSLSVIRSIEPPRKTVVYSATGDTIKEFYREKRTIVPLSKIPTRLQQAFLAIEDKRFYSHYGVDPIRIIKTVWVNLTTNTRPGASTITQQLAKNVFLDNEKTYTRKIKEVILAIQIEQTYSKDEILEMYLNEVLFGSGVYGVQEAANYFFNKDVWDLNDAEMTLITGVPNRPTTFSPFRHLDRAYERRRIVLISMVANGSLTSAEASIINETPVKTVDSSGNREARDKQGSYFIEEIRRQIEARYGYDGLYTDGLKVTTTMIPQYQQWMDAAAESHLLKMEAENNFEMTRAKFDSLSAEGQRPASIDYLQSASVLIDTRTGAVLALYGGRSYDDYKFNLAMQANRQPGSIFKPIVYLTALEHGYMPSSLLLDSPVVIDTGVSLWRPKNFNNKFMGQITLRYGLSRSKNVVTAKLINDFGVGPVLAQARRLGVKTELPAVHALALGAGEVNLFEMVSAYAAFANHGVRVEPYFITRVETADGEILEENLIQQTEVLDAATAYMMCSLMASTLEEGTARGARWRGFTKTGAGKTGTYNNYTDAWFVGFTPSYAAGVWVGFDKKVSMGKHGTGAHMAMPIWADYMGKITGNKPDEPFVRPKGIVDRLVCLRSSMLATTNCDSTKSEVFLENNFPQRTCDMHGGTLQDFEGLNRDFNTLDSEEDEFGL